MLDDDEEKGAAVSEAPGNEHLERMLTETVSETEAASGGEGKAQAKDAATVAQTAQAAENRKAALQLAESGALETVNTFAGLLNKRYPHITIDGDERQRVAAAAAPVVLKHAGGEMPAWLLPYAEEFRLGMALAGVGFGVWLQMQAHQEALAQAEQDRQNGITRNQQAARADGHPGAAGGGAAAPVRPQAPAVDLSTGGPMDGIPRSGAL